MKRIAAPMLVLVIALSFAACGGTGLEGFIENREVSFTSKETDGSLLYMTEYVCDGAYAFIIGEDIFYVEMNAEDDDVLYLLNSADKTGISIPTDKAFGESDYTDFSFEAYRELDVKKTGRGKIAGRAADIFLLEHNGIYVKFWVDRKADIILKCVMVDEAGEEVPDADKSVFDELGAVPGNFEITEIVTGTITPADMVNLEEYTIQPWDSLMGGSFGDPFDAAFYEAFGSSFDSSFGSSFGKALGGELGSTLGDAFGSMAGDVAGAFDSIGDVLGKIFS